MRRHRIPREYILAPAAEIKVPARMRYGGSRPCTAGYCAESPSANIRQTTSLFAILFGVPPFRENIGPPANSFCFKDNEQRRSSARELVYESFGAFSL